MTLAIRRTLATSMLLFPALFILVFILHFRTGADFVAFRSHYVPAAPERVVPALIRAHNQWPMIHDPHMLGYLALPVVVLCALALYAVGQEARPNASGAALVVTLSGIIYLGGVFAMWTAFYRGLGGVDPRYTEGAIATFAAMTAPAGAFQLTTSLAKLAMVGFALQALAVLGVAGVPKWSPALVVAGVVLFLCFWDLDNWMLIASVLILAGFLPLRRRLLTLPVRG
jgi:hypothetical protein